MSRYAVRDIISKGVKLMLTPCSPIMSVAGQYPANFISVTRGISKNPNNSELGHTTVLLQDRLDIQELPTIVRKVKDGGIDNMVTVNEDEISVLGGPDYTNEAKSDHSSKIARTFKVLNEEEEREVIEGFTRCSTTKAAFLLLETIPDEEVSPAVAFHALKRIIELENNQHYRNKVVHGDDMPENFTRTAVFNKLIDTVILGSDANLVLQCLKFVSRDMIGGNSAVYRDKLCNDVLIKVTEGKFSSLQVCELVKLFSLFKHKKISEDIDKLWIGFVDKGKEINEHNIVTFFRILPLLKASRKVIFNMLDERVYDVWWRLPSQTVVEILSVLAEIKFNSPRVLSILSRWLSTNIQSVHEDDLLGIVTGFYALDYVDDGIEKTLERFVKAKGVKVKDASLMAAIMEYCAKFRLRSTHILQGCGEYFTRYGNNLSPVSIKSFFVPFGLLDYHPSNGLKFWQVIENAMEEKFIQFRPDDAIDIMLACVYLEKYPINFVKRIFNPYFLDRLHSYKEGNALEVMRTKIKIFDTAMTLECPQYKGPLLARDFSAKSVWQDGRVKRLINNIYDSIVTIAGNPERISTSVIMSQLPVTELYVVDVLLHPNGMGASMLNFNFKRDRNLYIAMLIHVPEHYCSQGTHLLGPQVMKKRHLRRLGLRVADLDYSTLAKLKVHPKALEEYLMEKLETAEKAV